MSSVAIAAAGVAWAADNGAGPPKVEGTGQPTEKMQGDENGSTLKNGVPVAPQPKDKKIDRLPAKRGAPNAAPGAEKDDDASPPDQSSSQQGGGNETDNGSSDMTAPQNPSNPPTTLFPANPKPPADPGKPGNPVTPTAARA